MGKWLNVGKRSTGRKVIPWTALASLQSKKQTGRNFIKNVLEAGICIQVDQGYICCQYSTLINTYSIMKHKFKKVSLTEES